MFYVTRANESLEKPWGITTIGAFETESQALDFARKTMTEAKQVMQVGVVKLLHKLEISPLQFTESVVSYVSFRPERQPVDSEASSKGKNDSIMAKACMKHDKVTLY